MTPCRELERLLAMEAPESDRAAHRAACAACESLACDLELEERLVAGLATPAWSESLRESLLSIPARTVGCEDAELLIAASIEDELAAFDRPRLDFHLSRCEGCREAFETLAGVARLEAPKPGPWLAGRLSATRPEKPRSRWKGLLDPRAAIGFAYAAAVVVMLAGFNPADLARKAGAELRSETRSAAAVAQGSLADRIGAFHDRAARTLAVWRGRAGGYGRAVLSNVIALVMKSDEQSRRPPSPPHNGEERSLPKNETAIATWRA